MKLTSRIVLLTFVGGALGTALRWSLSFVIDSSFWAIAAVNLIGAFALGFFNGHRYFHTDARRALYRIGFCGGFTTLSGLMAVTISPATGFMVVVQFVLGVGVYLLGRLTGDSSSAESVKEADLV
jgi:fluoride ion exporter CrcB/FEX